MNYIEKALLNMFVGVAFVLSLGFVVCIFEATRNRIVEAKSYRDAIQKGELVPCKELK